MSKTYIVLRQSPNWGAISDSEFRKQSREFCAFLGRPLEEINSSVDIWNRTFKRSFFDVRREIKEVTLHNLAAIENAEILSSTEITNFVNFEEGFYIFIDDDDWLHPQTANLLANVENSQQANGFVWGCVAFGTHNEAIIQHRKIDGHYWTNNYAITEKYLNKSPENFNTVFQHLDINNLLERNSIEIKTKIIDEYWSVANKHPTSTTFMRRLGNESLLMAAVHNYLQRCEKIDEEITPSLEWARPLMNGMVRIFSELL